MRPSARGDGGLTTRARATTARERSQGAKAQLPKELSWIPDLVHGAFFAPCDVHSTGSKGEQVNLFSLSSRRSMCPACAAERDVFDTIQVRRATRAILISSVGPAARTTAPRRGARADDATRGFESSEMREKLAASAVFRAARSRGGDVRLTRATNRLARNDRFEGVRIITSCACKTCVSSWT